MRSWERLIRDAIGARRQWATWLLAVALLVASTGFPVPGSRAGLPNGKDHGRPFPCQDRPCGCRTAEQCWRSCCCFSDAQKLAWAKSNRVAAPDFVVAAAQAVTKRRGGTSTASCCDHATHDGETPTTESGQDRVALSHGDRGAGLVVAALALRCQGLSSLWSVVSGALPPVAVEAPTAGRPPVARQVTHNQRPSSDRAAPPVPPPRG